MTENQNNDNLERFFKANLEQYAPVPSGDFWERMGPVLPPKPSFWNPFARWAGLGLLAILVVSVLLLWRNDRAKVARLHRTVAQQQLQIEQLGEKAQDIAALEPTNSTNVAEQTGGGEASNSPAVSAPQTVAPSPNIAPKVKPARGTGVVAQFSPKTKNDQQALVENGSEKENAGQQNAVSGNSTAPINLEVATVNGASTDLQASLPAESAPESLLERLPEPRLSGFENTNAPSILKYIPVTRPQLKRHSRSYPGYSVEVGATAFRMPLGRLFQQDTFLSGRTALSYSTGIRVNYELTSSVALQVGYKFTNLRARRLALRYNSFPIMVQKRWAWGRRTHLEAKTGVSINSLLNARTESDGLSVKGLRTTWLGLHGGVAATVALSDKLTLITGPCAGLGLTQMTNGRSSWELGVGASVRYQL